MVETIRRQLINTATRYHVGNMQYYISDTGYMPWMDEYIEDESDECGSEMVDEVLRSLFIEAHTPTLHCCEQIGCNNTGLSSEEDIGEALYRLNKYVKCIRDVLRQECPAELVEPLKSARNCIYEAKNAVLEAVKPDAIGCNYIPREYFSREDDEWKYAESKVYLLLFRIGGHTFHAFASEVSWIAEDVIDALTDTAELLEGEVPALTISSREYEAAASIIAGVLRKSGYGYLELPSYVSI